MVIDTLFILLMVMAIFKGYSKGLVVAIFSFFAILIGIAAALKLSAVVAVSLQEKANLSGPWLPTLSFLLVLVGVIFLVRWGAALVKKAVSLALLGWADKLGGILLYALLYTLILSVVLFYAAKLNIISETLRASSSTYPFIAPLGPWCIQALSYIFPFFSNMFADLSRFFEKVAEKAG